MNSLELHVLSMTLKKAKDVDTRIELDVLIIQSIDRRIKYRIKFSGDKLISIPISNKDTSIQVMSREVKEQLKIVLNAYIHGVLNSDTLHFVLNDNCVSNSCRLEE